jgi:type IV pilus assembly protein PilV
MAAERRAPRRAARGVALIEVMVALLIFLIGVLGIVALQAKGVQFSVQAQDRSRAALLANEAVAAMWEQRSTALPEKKLKAWQDAVAAALPAGSASAVRAADGSATVTIRWTPPGAASIGGKAAESRYETTVVLP